MEFGRDTNSRFFEKPKYRDPYALPPSPKDRPAGGATNILAKEQLYKPKYYGLNNHVA